MYCGEYKKVILGGGRSYMTPTTSQDPETGGNGNRQDGQNLIDRWLSDHPKSRYVTNRDELLNVDITGTDSLLG